MGRWSERSMAIMRLLDFYFSLFGTHALYVLLCTVIQSFITPWHWKIPITVRSQFTIVAAFLYFATDIHSIGIWPAAVHQTLKMIDENTRTTLHYPVSRVELQCSATNTDQFTYKDEKASLTPQTNIYQMKEYAPKDAQRSAKDERAKTTKWTWCEVDGR